MSSRCLAAALGGVVLVGGCATPDTGQAQRQRAASGDSTTSVALNPVTITLQARRGFSENSGAAASAAQPGIYFMINDSGHQPMLYAFDSTGADRGAWRVGGARNEDWEAVSTGPCSASDTTSTAAASCVYIGDVGDNDAALPTRTIYKVTEPTAQGAGLPGDVTSTALVYRYPDHPHDVEAMYVAPNGNLFLITKRPLRTDTRQRRPALVFMLPASAWKATTAVVATLIDSLAIVPGSAPRRLITDAALSPDGRHLAVRTYGEVYVFVADSATGRVNGGVPPSVCDIAALGRWQGEGVAWYGASGRLLLTAEGRNSPMFSLECRPPEVAR